MSLRFVCRLLALSAPVDAEPAAGPTDDEQEDGIEEVALAAARSTMEWVAPMTAKARKRASFCLGVN